MDTLFSIGEALIDFIPQQTGCPFSEVSGFSPAVGGAPANVCGAFTRLGGKSQVLTQLGDDPFGHKIADELQSFGIGISHVPFTDKANTALAFVSLGSDGGRTFSFYRNPSSDLLLESSQIQKEWFQDAYALHFCSVSLVDYPIRQAHRTAISYAQDAGAMVSFDPNLRFSLWPDQEALRQIVWEFLPCSNILKISDEELESLTGSGDIKKALPQLLRGNVELLLYTCGKDGAWAFTRSAEAFAPSRPVKAIDTTGAGDAFIGSFLHSLYRDSIGADKLAALTAAQLQRYLAFSNEYCGRSVLANGAIASYPTAAEMGIL